MQGWVQIGAQAKFMKNPFNILHKSHSKPTSPRDFNFEPLTWPELLFVPSLAYLGIPLFSFKRGCHAPPSLNNF